MSSLSFLIEMDVMTEIEVRIEHESETFEFRFFSKNSQIDVLLDNYSGQYMMEINEIKNPKILLISFIDIIPSIINGYSEDIQNKEWTKDSKRKFILGLVDSVKEKLEGLYPSEEQQELNAIK